MATVISSPFAASLRISSLPPIPHNPPSFLLLNPNSGFPNASPPVRRRRTRFVSAIQAGDEGFVLEDVPHLTDYLPDLKAHPSPIKSSPAYAIVKQNFVSSEDVVTHEIVVQKSSPRGVHFRRAGPREKVYFRWDEVCACIVTCGGLCPGINTVIREIVCGLNYMYGVRDIIGIEGGYRGFYSKNTVPLTPKVVNDIHKRGGTVLRTSRGGHDTNKIVDSIQFRGLHYWR